MVYKMIYEVDGGCRGNGQPGAIGAAAAVEVGKYKTRTFTQELEDGYGYETPTNQRAEITAIILALRAALDRYERLDTHPTINVTIRSDSQYAVNCMNNWIYKWTRNGWKNSAGNPVVNQDLIKKASYLDDQVKELGDVKYEWVPRARNRTADEAVNDLLDEMR